jgi:hypothetical protein
VVLIAGLGTVTAAAWVAPPSLALFLAGGALTGLGSSAVFRGTLTITVSSATGETRAAALATYFIGAYAGLSVPVIGVGVALQYISWQPGQPRGLTGHRPGAWPTGVRPG